MAWIFGIATLTNCCCFLWAAFHLLIKERFWNYAKYFGIRIWSFHECAVAWGQSYFIFLSLLIQQLGIFLTLLQTSANSGSIGSPKWSSTKDKRPWYFLVTGSDSSSVCSCYPLMNIGFGCRIFILQMWSCCYGHRIILIAWSFGSARCNVKSLLPWYILFNIFQVILVLCCYCCWHHRQQWLLFAAKQKKYFVAFRWHLPSYFVVSKILWDHGSDLELSHHASVILASCFHDQSY